MESRCDCYQRMLLDLPETGMGFQLVEAFAGGMERPLLIFNSEDAFDLSNVQLENGDDPATILRNGLRIVELLKSGPATNFLFCPSTPLLQIIGLADIHTPHLTGGRRCLFCPSGRVAEQSRKTCIAYGAADLSPVFGRSILISARGPINGRFLPGTYAAPPVRGSLRPDWVYCRRAVCIAE